jgi:hypothetical protein
METDMTWTVCQITYDGWQYSLKPLGEVEAPDRNGAYAVAKTRFPGKSNLSIDPKDGSTSDDEV